MTGIKIRGFAGNFSEFQEEKILEKIEDKIDALLEGKIGAFTDFETVANLRSLRSKIRGGSFEFDLQETDFMIRQFEALRELEIYKRKGVPSRSKEYDQYSSAIARYKDAIKKITDF
jgi:hypothetical protein